LHLGNVCIRSTRGEDIANPSVSRTDGKLGFTGLEATIIDYTLSRADMNVARKDDADSDTSESVCSKSEQAADVAYLDLASEPEIFTGDGAVDYQYDIYR
jgi:serine/threonine-protein kinase haspin